MSIERDCKKIHKKIRKFYEKYKDKRNICLNLKCDKENNSYTSGEPYIQVWQIRKI